MSTIELVAGEVRASCVRAGEQVVVSFLGTADAQVDAQLEGFLGQVHAMIEREPVAEVIADLRHLEFMNSSCFKAFVTWLVAVRRLPRASQYRIRFRASERHHWQKRSLHALSYFGGDLITIEAG
ncbi:MAG: hypothetical protein IPK80_24000 [Nannocystis sp.]|nr:hypothetical protein [Nannocystis sp.]